MTNNNLHIFLLIVLVGSNLYYCSNAVSESEAVSVVESKKPRTWCVANTGANRQDLQDFLDYGCHEFDCSPILPGGLCYEPNVLLEHASWILDKFYREGHFCKEKLGFVTTTDPSHERCGYP